MPAKTPKNPRAKKLDAITGKLVMFLMGETTYHEEQEAQYLIQAAVAKIDAARDLLVAADAGYAAEHLEP